MTRVAGIKSYARQMMNQRCSVKKLVPAFYWTIVDLHTAEKMTSVSRVHARVKRGMASGRDEFGDARRGGFPEFSWAGDPGGWTAKNRTNGVWLAVWHSDRESLVIRSPA